MSIRAKLAFVVMEVALPKRMDHGAEAMRKDLEAVKESASPEAYGILLDAAKQIYQAYDWPTGTLKTRSNA